MDSGPVLLDKNPIPQTQSASVFLFLRCRLCAFPRVINPNRLRIGAIHQKVHFLPMRTCTTARQSVFMSVGFRGIAHVISHSLHLLIGAAQAEPPAVSERCNNYNELNLLAWPRMKPIQLDKSSCGFNARCHDDLCCSPHFLFFYNTPQCYR